MVRKIETFPPVTMGHIRGHGCRELLVYCGSGRCHHSANISGDWLPDDGHSAGGWSAPNADILAPTCGRIGLPTSISGTSNYQRVNRCPIQLQNQPRMSGLCRGGKPSKRQNQFGGIGQGCQLFSVRRFRNHTRSNG
jgi:hypothetical protein